MIRNLTPHPIRLYSIDREDGVDDLDELLIRVIEPEEKPARLAMIEIGTTFADGIPVEMVEYGHAHDLPPQRDGVFLIVSLVVGLANVHRRDLRVPYLEVRNASGTVIGCRMLAQPV